MSHHLPLLGSHSPTCSTVTSAILMNLAEIKGSAAALWMKFLVAASFLCKVPGGHIIFVQSSWWPHHFCAKFLVAASFLYKVSGGRIIFVQSSWWPHHSCTKFLVAASFLYKVPGGRIIFVQSSWWPHHFCTKFLVATSFLYKYKSAILRAWIFLHRHLLSLPKSEPLNIC